MNSTQMPKASKFLAPELSAFALGVPPDLALTICDSSQAALAVSDLIAARECGELRSCLYVLEPPRVRLFRHLASYAAARPTYDEQREICRSIARGTVNVDGRPQLSMEQQFMPDANVFRHLCAIANAMLFYSRASAELATNLTGYRPPNVRLAPIPPAGPRAPLPREDVLAIFAPSVAPELVELYKRQLSDIPLKIIEVLSLAPDGSDDARALERSRIIVDLTGSYALAAQLSRFGNALVSCARGIGEAIENALFFELYDIDAAIDAVLVSLGLPPPRVVAREACWSYTQSPQSVRPLVSIGVTVYDRLQGLDATLESLQRQVYDNVEIVVVSNAGPDASSICAKYGNVRYHHRSENSGGASATRNDAFSLASGEYLTALDDDDDFMPDHIERMIAIARRGAKVVYSDMLIQVVETGSDGIERVLGYDFELSPGMTVFELLVANRIGYLTVFFAREVWETLGGYSPERAKSGEEQELWLRYGQRFPLVHSPVVSTKYTMRTHSTSLTATEYERYPTGFENVYKRYPAADLPIVEQHRKAYLEQLRTQPSRPRLPRYARQAIE